MNPTRAALLLAALSACPLAASTVVEGSIGEDFQSAEFVLAVVVTAREQVVSEHPYTRYQFSVEAAYKGSEPLPAHIDVAGGTLPDGSSWKIEGAPRFDEGDRLLLFLRFDNPYCPIIGLTVRALRLEGSSTADLLAASVLTYDSRPVLGFRADGTLLTASQASRTRPLLLGSFLDGTREIAGHRPPRSKDPAGSSRRHSAPGAGTGAKSLSAWVYAGYWWWDRFVHMKTGALGPGQLDGTSYQELTAAAISNWYLYCDPEPSLSFTQSTDDCSSNTGDGVNCTGWADLGQCEPGPTITLGQTIAWPSPADRTRVVEADVSMSSRCRENGFWTPTRFLAVMTHEMGHVVGLAHSLATPALMNEYLNEEVWHPEADDCAGVQSIYTPPVPPTVTTHAASLVGQSSATLHGAVNPNGSNTIAWFNICCSDGGSGMTLSGQAVGPGKTSVPLSSQTGTTAFGMQCNTVYRFHVAAQNVGGTVFGEEQYFTTMPCAPPTVSSSPATSIAQGSATLNGSVNANGADTSAYFQWGVTTAYTNGTAAQAIGSGQNSVALGHTLGNLACGTSYHFRVVAVNPVGSSVGGDRLLTTGTCDDTGSPVDGFYTLVPCRAFDSRTDAPLLSGLAATIPLAGASPCPIPASAMAVALNVTVVSPDGQGHLVLWPAGQPVPPTSTINFSRGQVRANNAIVPVGVDGQAGILAILAGGGSVHCIVDVTGYFEKNPPE